LLLDTLMSQANQAVLSNESNKVLNVDADKARKGTAERVTKIASEIQPVVNEMDRQESSIQIISVANATNNSNLS
jgi:hypothetical protein